MYNVVELIIGGKNMKKFFQEFKEFALRGNVMDLAVGVIIGGAFQAIVNSLVKDIISPLIGLFAKTDFNDLVINVLGVNIKYGSFITNVINFIIMAFIIFMLIKGLNKLAEIGKKKNDLPEEPTTKICPYCLSEIPINATKCAHCTSELSE
ncbi:large conductance mechanosensitive channel protein [Anaerofustis stercorihominis DSM 17244]|uniref:Large-conductance mechanosensitive channel n=2 Tax=Anaerofustis stercorihominis TaxID=214853 RepID=B1C6L2_9FIRM|nr:large conductance mechanosensitive channel protein [Anaerofustis stercorihominis DSM 17244]